MTKRKKSKLRKVNIAPVPEPLPEEERPKHWICKRCRFDMWAVDPYCCTKCGSSKIVKMKV